VLVVMTDGACEISSMKPVIEAFRCEKDKLIADAKLKVV